MDKTHYTTEHRKGQHLLSEERHEIEVRLKDGWSIYRIAKHLGRPYNTIKNEVKRGTVLLYNGKQKRYKADAGEHAYHEHRENCRRVNCCLKAARFLAFVVSKVMGDEKWSLDAAFGYALNSNEFRRDEIVCTKTLYNYVDLGLLPIKNIDLPEKLRRNTKAKKSRENKRNLEFANLSLFEDEKLKVYFTHPYSSWEKGTNECHNKLLRRFIPKGKSISDYDADDICFFADCINGLPRKILGYRTPEMMFESFLDAIYAA